MGVGVFYEEWDDAWGGCGKAKVLLSSTRDFVIVAWTPSFARFDTMLRISPFLIIHDHLFESSCC